MAVLDDIMHELFTIMPWVFLGNDMYTSDALLLFFEAWRELRYLFF